MRAAFFILPFLCNNGLFIIFAFKLFYMKMIIDLFLPQLNEDFSFSWVSDFAGSHLVNNIYVMGREEAQLPSHPKLRRLAVGSLTATETFLRVAEEATADYVLFFSKGVPEIALSAVEAFCGAVPDTASMAYADYYKIVDGVRTPAPTIDYQEGSLRNDFDFGSVLLFRTTALKEYLSSTKEMFKYAGLYQLRLALSRVGSLFHYNEFLYAEPEEDKRKSGEKQFDYVNPAQREVQVEMEKVCTAHLSAIGGCLPACKYRGIDLSAGSFPVEASVIIPVLNRVSTIGDAVRSVLEQETSFSFNIIVVDNHSTDGTQDIIDAFADERVVHIIPERTDLGIGGCWNEAVNSPACGRFAVQLDSDDLYSSPSTLQRIVDEFYKQQCAMMVGTYRICDFELNTLPPGVIDHREWSEENGRNNALRINGLGAPRAFYTPVIREIGFPNVSYGEDYAVGLQVSRNYRIGRIYDVLYLCRRWGGNSDAALSHEKVNAHNFYKDSLRTAELKARVELMKSMQVPSIEELKAFFEKQLSVWPAAASRYDALKGVEVRTLDNGLLLQYNSARAVSTGAKVDAQALAERPCFLCAENRPAEQGFLESMGSFEVLVNPFPILPSHFTIASKVHAPQLLKGMFADMLHMARGWQGMALFYNGAKCGASAPDHAHLQAVNVPDIPLLGDAWSEVIEETATPVHLLPGSLLYLVTGYVVPLFKISARSVADAVVLMELLVGALPVVGNEEEPRMNVISYYDRCEGYVVYVIPRSGHRPQCYGCETAEQRLVSPGTLDMAGLLITPRRCDFDAVTAKEATDILCEVALDLETAIGVCDVIVGDDEEC